jgi:hypothetical protein
VVLLHSARFEYLKLRLGDSSLYIIEGKFPLLRHLDLELENDLREVLVIHDSPFLRSAVLGIIATTNVVLPWAQLTRLILCVITDLRLCTNFAKGYQPDSLRAPVRWLREPAPFRCPASQLDLDVPRSSLWQANDKGSPQLHRACTPQSHRQFEPRIVAPPTLLVFRLFRLVLLFHVL